jgi:MFS family permease
LTISGYLIDVLGVKYSLLLGYMCISISKFILTFADSLSQLYFVMCSISPFGISIIFPCLVLGVKRLSGDGPFRKLCFSIYFGFMVIGGVLGGPIVDYIRRDIGKT